MDNRVVQSPPLAPTTSAPTQRHYENFPVASWLCPAHLRAPIAAIYWFARTADDLADEGSADAATRLAQLAAYRVALAQAADPGAAVADQAWPQVFGPLAQAIAQHALPLAPLQDLLSAFEQDVQRTASGSLYADRTELLDYCRRSANPIGRLLLHLYGVHDSTALAQSDAICTALQLINFWQDPSRDLPRRRVYFTLADCARHQVPMADLLALRQTPNTTNLIADCAQWARVTMLNGLPLVHRIPGRAGWELRLVAQGGLRILDKLQAQGHNSLQQRPTIGKRDLPLLLARSLVM